MRQGPHHSAQKSTTTGSDDFRTSASKLASVTLLVAMTGRLSVSMGGNATLRQRSYERRPPGSRRVHRRAEVKPARHEPPETRPAPTLIAIARIEVLKMKVRIECTSTMPRAWRVLTPTSEVWEVQPIV